MDAPAVLAGAAVPAGLAALGGLFRYGATARRAGLHALGLLFFLIPATTVPSIALRQLGWPEALTPSAICFAAPPIALAAVLLLELRRHGLQRRLPGAAWAAILFLAVGIAYVPVSGYWMAGIYGVLTGFRWVFLFLLVVLLEPDPIETRLIVRWMLLGVAATAASGIVEEIAGFDWFARLLCPRHEPPYFTFDFMGRYYRRILSLPYSFLQTGYFMMVGGLVAVALVICDRRMLMSRIALLLMSVATLGFTWAMSAAGPFFLGTFCMVACLPWLRAIGRNPSEPRGFFPVALEPDLRRLWAWSWIALGVVAIVGAVTIGPRAIAVARGEDPNFRQHMAEVESAHFEYIPNQLFGVGTGTCRYATPRFIPGIVDLGQKRAQVSAYAQSEGITEPLPEFEGCQSLESQYAQMTAELGHAGLLAYGLFLALALAALFSIALRGADPLGRGLALGASWSIVGFILIGAIHPVWDQTPGPEYAFGFAALALAGAKAREGRAQS